MNMEEEFQKKYVKLMIQCTGYQLEQRELFLE